MAEKRLDFSPLEARGVYLMQQSILKAKEQAEQAAFMLKNASAEAETVLKGRLPDGLTILNLRIDQATDSIYCPAE